MKHAQYAAHDPKHEKKDRVIQTSLVVVFEKIKGPYHMFEGKHHIRKRPQPPPTHILQDFFRGTESTIWLSPYQESNPEKYG